MNSPQVEQWTGSGRSGSSFCLQEFWA